MESLTDLIDVLRHEEISDRAKLAWDLMSNVDLPTAVNPTCIVEQAFALADEFLKAMGAE